MYYNTDTRPTEEIVASEYPFWSYVRTDRNGTRYFANCKCDRCNGKGVIPYYGYIDGGVCFECGGSGRSKPHEVKVYTPAHAEKLAAQAEARHQKAEKERIERLKKNRGANLEKAGFGVEDGVYVIYRVVGNTFSIKDELKAAGCRFNSAVGWYSSVELENYECQRMEETQVLEESLEITWKAKDAVSPLYVENTRRIEESTSEYVGEIGKRMPLDLHIERRIECGETSYSYYNSSMKYLYLMKDASGNEFKWITTCYYEDGRDYQFMATIKDHSEYNGIKQTVLTRVSKRK